MQVIAASVCAPLALADIALNEKGEASEVVHQGLDILAGLEKGGRLPAAGIDTLNLLKELERAFPGQHH